jgi:hypothetical protein
MKKIVALMALLGTASAGLAQGTLNFSSFATGVNAPATNVFGTRITAGTAPGGASYVAGLFFSTSTNAASSDLQFAGFTVPFSTLTLSGGGYFLGGARTINGASGAVVAQVRVWDLSRGTSYDTARNGGGEYGESNLILVNLALPPAPPPPMTGLQGFGLKIIPEPSTFALAGLGAAALLIFRRRKQ